MKPTLEEEELIPRSILFADDLFENAKEREAYNMIRSLLLEINSKLLASHYKEVDIYIPALDYNCPAALALKQEKIKYNIEIMKNDFSYGKFMKRLWQKNKGFILLEHDIVPWPEALTNLMYCNHPWCHYKYGIDGSTLGCIKFSDYIVQNTQDLPLTEEWKNKHWSILVDYVVFPLREKYGLPHAHYPALAHVKEYAG